MNLDSTSENQSQAQQLAYTAAITTIGTSSTATTASSGDLNSSEQENLMRMNKNIVDNSSNCTEWNQQEKEEKEEEEEDEKKEEICVLYRRESVPADLATVKNNESNLEHSDTSLTSLPSLKTSGNEKLIGFSIQAVEPSNTLSRFGSSAAIAQTEEHPQQQQEQQIPTQSIPLHEPTSCSSAAAERSTDSNCSTSNPEPNRTPSPTSIGARSNSSTNLKGVLQKVPSLAKLTNDSSSGAPSANNSKLEEDSISKSSDTSGELVRGISTQDNNGDKFRSTTRLSERAKKKSWYNVLCPNYKSRCQDFKKLFKEVPSDERLIVDYSCALQRDILVQGRLYVSQNYVCFYANIFRWETYLSLKWKDVTAITKERTALVIPNAISISTAKEKYFFATFAARDKSFLMLFRVWQNTLMNKQMQPLEMWQWVHSCYGDELGLTTDDEDYIDPTSATNEAKAEAEAEDSEVEFVSATDETSSQLGRETESEIAVLIEESASASTNCDDGYRQFGVSVSRSGLVSLTNSTISLGNNIANITKSIRKTNSSSSTTTTSSSDNKTSDNNSSSADSKGNPPKSSNLYSSKSSSSNNNMRSNGKELTSMSAQPSSHAEEGGTAGAVSGTNGAVVDIAGCGNGAGSGGSGTGNENKSASFVYDGKRKVAKNSRQRDDGSNKNLPTDVSDSSDSADENKIPFVATAECNSTHEGRQLVHTILPINIDTLFNLLFSKSKFLTDFHTMRKSSDTNFGDWETSEDGQQTRTVNLTVSLSAAVGPKTSKVTEYQVMRDCSKPGELYSIDINTINAGIPYADSFSVMLHYCFVRTIDDHTMLSVHAQIKYKKSIWGVVKGFIEKNTWAGLEDFYTSLLHALQSETNIPPAKGKGRRPRRGTAALVRPLDEISPAIQIKPEVATEKILTPDTLTPKQPIVSKVIPSENTCKYKWLSFFVIVLLILLILLNVILLLKLWKLEIRMEGEYHIRTRLPDFTTMKELPKTSQDWIELVRQQEILHEAEIKRWHKVLQTAIELLKKTENTLVALMFH